MQNLRVSTTDDPPSRPAQMVPVQGGSARASASPEPSDTTTELALAERISLLNHDIRAAMSDVIGGLRLVESDQLPPETRTQLDRVRSSGEVLARLLEEALSFIDDSSGSEVTATNLHLGRFLRDLDLRWSGRARAHGVGFSVSVAPNVPQVIYSDRMALDRILGNLLSNALKYAGRTGVEMQVSLSPDRDVEFRVCDDGPGFSDQAMARLFQFAARPQDSDQPGSGLGLRIAKDMSDALGGRLEVRNRAPLGAETTLSLPRSAWELASPGMVSDDLPDLTGLKVLMAEDNETNQLLSGRMLEIMGAEYEIARDGVEALNWLEREDFDIALIDIEMPKLNGIEVIRAFRNRPGPQSAMPMIALTAYVLKTNRDAIFNAGADGIIAKPVLDIATFGQALARHVETARATSVPAPETVLADIEDPARLDPGRIEELLHIAGPASARELLDRLLADLGRVQGQLAAATPDTDRAVMRAESHVLISLSGAIGAPGLYSLATALNEAAHRNDTHAVVTLANQTGTALLSVLAEIRAKRSTVPPPA